MKIRPQRFPLAPIGSLLKPALPAARRRDVSEASKGGDLAYLGLVRCCPCLYCGQDPCGEAAHVKFSSAAFGMKNMLGKRVEHSRALPLCRQDHLLAKHAQHNGSEEGFWADLGIVPYAVTSQLYAKRGDLVAMRAVIFVTIANREKQS